MTRSIIGKILYGMLFVVILPSMLFLWAEQSKELIALPVVTSEIAAVILAVVGFVMMLVGMVTLMRFGEGLPMNAYPPKRYVNQGLYRLIGHPIYFGFCTICIGLSIAYQSPSGLWLVSPVVILGCVALVEGFEKPDLRARFGPSLGTHIISLPSNEDRPSLLRERLSVYLLVLVPWLVGYEAFVLIGVPADAINAFLPFEARLPLWEWTEIIYASVYVVVAATPLLIRSSRILREFSVAALVSTGIGMLMFVALPFIAPPRAFTPETFLGTVLMLDRGFDSAAAAFPSFHVIWAILCAFALGQSFPRFRFVFWTYAVLASASCITTGMHAIIDVLAGIVVAWMGIHIGDIWHFLRTRAERTANSWHEWHVGTVRIINHGLYAGIGTFLGLMIIQTAIGSAYIVECLIVALSSLVCAALWAQIIEGSPSLLRPYGYYGGLVGVFIGVFIVHAIGGDAWLLLSAFAIAGPVIQAFGRMRCLVQGCCHGREAPEVLGIRYTHPRSRVTRLSNLGGIPIHPTPLYSILWNAVTFTVLARLWNLSAPLPLICGLYLILNSLGRFVEEAYRGEPQTPILGPLRLYQIMSIVGTLAGIFITTLRTSSVLPEPLFNWQSLAAAFGFGLLTWFALGVDFPGSNKRFARLV